MKDRITSLRRAVEYGIANGKKNMIVDMDVLQSLFAQSNNAVADERERCAQEAEAHGRKPGMGLETPIHEDAARTIAWMIRNPAEKPQ